MPNDHDQQEADKSMDANGEIAFYGSAVKALGEGRVGGYLVIFSGPDAPDLEGDYFTKETNFFIEQGDKKPILYRHGKHKTIKDRVLGRATLTIDDVGVFVEGELLLRDKYEKAIYMLAEEGKLGWSSGSMLHLSKSRPRGKSMEITSWGIGEATLSPMPAEPRASAYPIKSLELETDDLDAFIEDEQTKKDFDIAGIPALKTFCEDVSPSSLKDGSQRSKSAADAVKEFVTIGGVLGEAFHSYTSRLVRRSENRFLKDQKAIDPSTVSQVEGLLADIDRVMPQFNSLKEVLEGIKKISDLSKAERKAMDEKASYALWNYYRISGNKPKELENARSTS